MFATQMAQRGLKYILILLDYQCCEAKSMIRSLYMFNSTQVERWQQTLTKPDLATSTKKFVGREGKCRKQCFWRLTHFTRLKVLIPRPLMLQF